MIIGYNFFNKDFHGVIFDTAIPTSEQDELTIGAGIYDQIFVSVDTAIDDKNVKPDKWNKKNIMNAKFKNDLEAGSLDADGYVITKIQIYRRKYLVDKDWILVGQFDYDKLYNTYSFIDRTVENQALYEYSIVPIAKEVIGDITTSEPIKVEYDGIYISDLENNYKMEMDLNFGDVTYNKNSSTITPLNSQFPIVIYGNQNYKSGNISFLSVTDDQVKSGGTELNGREERIHRDKIVNFLQKSGAKVIRNSNGEVMIIATNNIKTTPKEGFLLDIHSVGFDYTQLGDMDSPTLIKGGLVGSALKSNYTYDENGEIIWEM